MWKGRFAQETSALVQRYGESVSFDWRLFAHDIAGSIAHSKGLLKAGILTAEEQQKIESGLLEIRHEIEKGNFEFKESLEDVHMNIESELTKRIGPAGAKLHTARSRNDQIATDVRLYCRSTIDSILQHTRAMQAALIECAERGSDAVMPGYTHLQRGQPVFFAHHLLAYVEMLDRDAARLADCRKRLNVMPLGSGALAGSTIILDREFVAQQLGFDGVTQNSMDAVSDRDFVAELLFAISLQGVHLSRLSEDVILWASAEFGFVTLSDAHTTGSSLMPQKKNPDVAELTRGKSARLIGNLMSILTLLKGLPMTYNRDLQEDKERLFDTADTVRASTRLMAAMLAHTQVNRPACAAAASDPALLATDLADYLVRQGLAFRPAHHAVGAVVALAEKSGKPLNQLTLAELQSVDKHFGRAALDVFNLKTAMAKRNQTGAPGTKEVAKQLKRWRQQLS